MNVPKMQSMSLNRPVTPDEVSDIEVKRDIPNVVYNAFNHLIARQWNGVSVMVRLNDVVNVLVATGIGKEQIFSENMLDVEDAYRSRGWTVSYDTTGVVGETVHSFWTFTKP